MGFFKLLLNKFPKDYVICYVFDIVSKMFTIAISLFVIRLTSIEAYADYTLFNSISTFLYGIFGSGLALSFVRYYVEQKSRGSGKYKGLFANVQIVLTVIFILLFGLICFAQIFVNVQSIIYLTIFYGLFLSLGNINQAYFQANNRFDMAGIVNNIRNIILFFMIGIIYLYNEDINLHTILYVFIISSAASFAMGLILVYKNGEETSFINTSVLKNMLLESLWLVIYCFLLNLFNQLDIFMLKAFTDDYTMAQYGVAYKYYGIVLSLLPVIQNVLRVKTSNKEFIDNKERQIFMTINWVKKMTPMAVIMVISAISLSGIIMPILNTEEYNSAIPLFNILIIGAGISYITAPNVGIMMASGKHKLMCLFALIAFLINFIGNYFFIPLYGAFAASITTVVSQMLLNVSCTIAIIMQKKVVSK